MNLKPAPGFIALNELINESDKILSTVNENSMSDILWLLSAYFEMSQSEVFLKHHQIAVSDAQIIQNWVQQRISGKPMQYIAGKTFFFGYKFLVQDNVFIPRPETEILVEEALTVLDELELTGQKVNLLDIGCGCGTIPITIALQRPEINCVCFDRNPSAVNCTRKNLEVAQLTNVQVFEHDYRKGISLQQKFQIITANLPYIPKKSRINMSPEVLDFEPESALFSGEDGLDDIRIILGIVPDLLDSGSFLILETNHDHFPRLPEIIDETVFAIKKLRTDYNGQDRIAVLVKK